MRKPKASQNVVTCCLSLWHWEKGVPNSIGQNSVEERDEGTTTDKHCTNLQTGDGYHLNLLKCLATLCCNLYSLCPLGNCMNHYLLSTVMDHLASLIDLYHLNNTGSTNNMLLYWILDYFNTQFQQKQLYGTKWDRMIVIICNDIRILEEEVVLIWE